MFKTKKNINFILNQTFSLLRRFNVCMWHSGRCGSTVIANLIEEDGRIIWGSEILENFSNNPTPIPLDSKTMLSHVRSIIRSKQMSAGYHPFGIEMKLWHYKRLGLEMDEVYDLLRRMNFGSHIILERRNHLRALVSGRVAFLTGNWHVGKGQKVKPVKIKLNVANDELRDEIELHERFYDDLKNMLPSDSLYISYEDEIEKDPMVGYKKILEYFEYKPKKISVKLRKTNPRPLSEIIENYSDVKDFLSTTPYQWMIESE